MTSIEAHVPQARGGFRPAEYAHIVLRTAQPDALIDWYCTVLGMQVVMRHPLIIFLTWDESQDRLAILPTQGAVPSTRKTTGMDHAAFEVGSLKELTGHYRDLKAKGIVPERCINHGVATSLYYRDPDDNQIELSVGAFKSAAELNTWFSTGLFDVNPVGVFIDPELLCARVESGEPESEILKPHPRHAEFLAELMASGLPE